MTQDEVFALSLAGALIVIVLFFVFFAAWALIDRAADRRDKRNIPATADMIDEFSRLAIARERRDRKAVEGTGYGVRSAENQIREFLGRAPYTQMRALEDIRKEEYAHTTAAEMMRKHDPERSAAYIRELEASIRQQDPLQPLSFVDALRNALKKRATS